MPTSGPRTTYRYGRDFRTTAVRLSQLPWVAVCDVAESLYIHSFMLSRWRKQAREGLIMTKGVAVDKAVAAELKHQAAAGHIDTLHRFATVWLDVGHFWRSP